MTYDELVLALQAAIDDPPVDGSAGEGDEQTAELLLERLVSTKGRADGAANAITGTPENPGATERAAALHAEYLAEVASWTARRTMYFEELDRSTRAVETILQDRVTPGADSEVDAMDPGVAGDVGDIPAALARGRQAVAVAKRHKINTSVRDGLTRSIYFASHIGAEPVETTNGSRDLARAQASKHSADTAYSQAFNAAAQFVEYLEITP